MSMLTACAHILFASVLFVDRVVVRSCSVAIGNSIVVCEAESAVLIYSATVYGIPGSCTCACIVASYPGLPSQLLLPWLQRSCEGRPGYEATCIVSVMKCLRTSYI